MNEENQEKNQGGAVAKPVSMCVIGVGGAGGNVVSHLQKKVGFEGVQFVAANTDIQALAKTEGCQPLQLGSTITRGLGAGGDPEIGRAAALSDLAEFKQVCSIHEIVVIVAGLGGGTGTGAGPVLAKAARESGALVLGVSILPFEAEGRRRQRQAQTGLHDLKQAADSVICFPNQMVFQIVDEETQFLAGFEIINDLLGDAVEAIWRLLHKPGLINVDFADICSVLRARHGENCFASIVFSGEWTAQSVVEKLFENPLLEGGKSLESADAVLLSLVGGPDLTLTQVNQLLEAFNRYCEEAHLIVGAAVDAGFQGRVELTLLGAQGGGSSIETEMDLPRVEAVAPKSDFDSTFFKKHEVESVAPSSETGFSRLSERERKELYVTNSEETARYSRRPAKWTQTTLPLDAISRGCFSDSEPSVHQGQDLDVPTYIRRGIALN